MVQSKFDFLEFDIALLEDAERLNQGVFLWIMNPEDIPPHLGLSEDGHYFSLKKTSLDYSKPVSQLYNVIVKKGIPCLFLEFSVNDLKDIRDAFKMFTFLDKGMTCLDPIKDVLNDTTSRTVHDLLMSLESKKSISSIYSVNLPQSFMGLADYSREELIERFNSNFSSR